MRKGKGQRKIVLTPIDTDATIAETDVALAKHIFDTPPAAPAPSIATLAKNLAMDEDHKRERIKSHIRDYERMINDHAKMISNYSQNMTRLQLELADLPHDDEALAKHIEESLLKEFDIIRKMPLVESITVSGDTITVHTSMIYITCAKRTFRIGKFDIVYDGLNRYTQTKLINTTGLISNGFLYAKCHHPHAGDHVAGICWGNIGPAISTLVAKLEYATATGLIIEWLQNFSYWTYKPDWLTRFPEVTNTKDDPTK